MFLKASRVTRAGGIIIPPQEKGGQYVKSFLIATPSPHHFDPTPSSFRPKGNEACFYCKLMLDEK